MKEHPILFSGQMVRAILEGRKTQTRRVIRDQPSGPDIFPPNGYETADTWFFRDAYYADEAHPNIGKYVRCPYGVIGDCLWVRETWCPVDDTPFGGEKWIDYRATPRYESSHPAGWENAPDDAEALKWKPSIHMPRWASRITLEVLKIRVERLKQITFSDIEAEGTPAIPYEVQLSYRNDGYQRYKDFQWLWDSINEKRGFGWDVNPWVWVIEFQRRG